METQDAPRAKGQGEGAEPKKEPGKEQVRQEGVRRGVAGGRQSWVRAAAPVGLTTEKGLCVLLPREKGRLPAGERAGSGACTQRPGAAGAPRATWCSCRQDAVQSAPGTHEDRPGSPGPSRSS